MGAKAEWFVRIDDIEKVAISIPHGFIIVDFEQLLEVKFCNLIFFREQKRMSKLTLSINIAWVSPQHSTEGFNCFGKAAQEFLDPPLKK